MPSIRCGWEELTIDQPGSISANKHVRREEKRARNRLRERETERERMSEKVTERKSQFDPIRLLGVWRCKWDDWPVIAGLMLGNQSPSGLDINKHPSNCPFFFLIPPPLPGPAWPLTNNATTMRAEQWCRLKKPQGGWIDSLALAARARRKHACLGFCLCWGDLHSFYFLFSFLSSLSPSFPLAEEHAVVDGDIITQSGVCGQFPVIWTFA